MHPQLDKNRFNTCEKLMDALEQCHRQEFLKQCLGLCNFEKEQLIQCLHFQRVEDAKVRILANRAKQKAWEQHRKENYEEAYGKNGYLKKVLEAEAAKTDNQ
ncbi:COX assembly mitochondrial protein 2 [Candida viswanathii]|uniref:COX assembly mitochondrial protein n=1 Tax=Candida viswanathii TaxID=5486 RepID=A0A367YIH7_9ASCO|nr:COX assembly mitochondrial protein 2 [Candida viswanathii]